MKQRFYLCLVILLFPVIALADSSAIIIQGIGGSDELEKKFTKWGKETQEILVSDLGFSQDRVILLSGDATRKMSIESAFDKVRQQMKEGDNFLLFLIGHGSFDTDYKLNIMGQDLKGAEYSTLIDSLKPARTVIVCSTASSGGLFDTVAGRDRVIIAASRSGEKEDTVFYEHFLAGLKGDAADEDKDKKISVWEAFKFATSGVERFYKEETRLITEHAGLSANGAAQVAASVPEQDAPVLARVTSINAERPIIVADSRLQALLNEKKTIEQRIETLRLDKSLLPEAEYDQRLEELILELARKNQEIQEQEKK